MHHETDHGLILPTEEEKSTLRRVAGKMPVECYYLCAVEFAERASYYGCQQVYKNFIRGPLPPDGPGTGASAPGSQYPAGALGRGSVTATAMTEAFKFLAYALPILFGWMADTKYGRFKMICWGVAVCGVAHVIMVISAIPSILQSGKAIGPFALSLYMLSIGAGLSSPPCASMCLALTSSKLSSSRISRPPSWTSLLTRSPTLSSRTAKRSSSTPKSP